MYIRGTLSLLRRCPETLLLATRNVSEETGKSRFFIALSAIYCSLRFGVLFTEYQAFDFYHRTNENRKTFVTVGWLVNKLKKYNPEEYRSCFHDKIKFNTLFDSYLNREWGGVETSDQNVLSFLSRHKRVVLKQANGCSGKQVYVANSQDSPYYLLGKIRNEKYNLMEEVVSNCKSIAKLNPTSLNTMRVVTIRSNDYFKVICACLRIGAIGSSVDNVSCGGTSARINLDTHKLDSVFFANSYRRVENSQEGRNEIGFTIPYWDETIHMLKEASKIVPQIHIVGWDIAITDKGPALIEGNESFHTVVMQVYSSLNEPGIKREFEEAISHIN